MRIHRRRTIGAVTLALTALLHSQTALAQACLAPEDVSDAGIHAVPALVEGIATSCAPHLAAQGYLATRGAEFAAPYVALQDSRWPGTLRVFLAMSAGGKGGSEASEMMAELPQDALRPLVDAMVAQEIGKGLKPADCTKIERAMELLAPLPPENFGGLVSFLLDVTGVKNPLICPEEKP